MQATLHFAFILLTCALTGFLGGYAWRQGRTPGARVFMGLALGVSLLALAESMSMLSATQPQAQFWYHTRTLLAAFLPVLWIVFALEHSGRKGWCSKRLLAGLVVIPVVTQVMLCSNSLHGLWVQQGVSFYHSGSFWIADTSARVPGVWYLVDTFYGLILMVAGISLIVQAAWHQRGLYRRQAFLLTGGALVALATSTIAAFDLKPQGELDPFIPGLGLCALLMALAVFRSQFLKWNPAHGVDREVREMQLQANRSLAVFLLVFILMVTGFAAVGYSSYRSAQRRLRSQVESQLSGVVALKVSQLQAWRRERLANGEVLHQNRAFGALLLRHLEDPPDAPTQAAVQAFLDGYRTYGQYDRVFLLDSRGAVRLTALGPTEQASSHLVRELPAVLNAGQVTFLDFYRDSASDPAKLAILVPIPAARAADRPVGVLVLRIDPNTFLYPFLREWPVPSATAETLLVRREGAEVVFLNALKFQANAALNLRFSVDQTQLPAVRAALGHTGIVDGVDYRGAPVIAHVSAVPDSPWFLVARVDVAELRSPLRVRLWQLGMFLAALVAASTAGLSLVWRRHRERLLRGQVEGLRKFREIFDEAPVGYHELDAEGRIVRINRTELEMLGCASQEVLGRHVWELIGEREISREAVLAKLAGTSPPGHSTERTYRRKDGTPIFASCEDRLIRDDDGRITGIRTTIQDITERKQAEERLRKSERLFRDVTFTMADWVWEVDEKGVYTYSSSQGSELLGDVIGMTPFDFMPPDEAERVAAIFSGIVQNKAPIKDVENWNIGKSGQQICFLTNGVPILDEAGNLKGYRGVDKDITERKLAETKLRSLLTDLEASRSVLLSLVEDERAARAETDRLNSELDRRVRDRTAALEAANKELEAFSYSVSHDLRAPLRAINGFARILAEDHGAQLDADGQRVLGVVCTEALHMGQLIDDLLRFSRLGRQQLRIVPTDMTALVREAYAEVSRDATHRTVNFRPDSLPAAPADPALLRQVWFNLLDNALKFTRHREQADIAVAGSIRNGEAVYSIRDNGAGFDMKYAGKLFGVFQRLHQTAEFEGTGVGLALAQRIVHAHGGQIWADAEPDRGATFYFTLPVSEQPATADDSSAGSDGILPPDTRLPMNLNREITAG